MALDVPDPSNGDTFNQSCGDRRVAVEVDSVGGYVEIPTMEVESWISKEGVSDKNCVTEVHFPAEWYDRSVLAHIDAFDPGTQESYDTAVVKWQDVQSGQWYSTHLGYVRAVGGTDEPNLMRMWVSDPADMTTAIPINVRYGPQTVVSTVLDDAATVFEENTAFPDVRTRVLDDRTVVNAKKVVATHQQITVESSDAQNQVKTARQFKANRNVLADVLNWVTETVGGAWYFEGFIEDGDPVLTLVYDPLTKTQQFSDQHTDAEGSVDAHVLENDALREMMPVNAVTVNGQSLQSIKGISPGIANPGALFSNKWPTATAIYEPLQEQAGQTMAPPVREADTASLTATEEKARKFLKEMMLGAPQGDVQMKGKPDLEPYDKLTSVPICNSQVEFDVPPLDYEVQKIKHHKQSDGEFETRAHVSIWVDPDEITITESKFDDGSDSSPDEGSGGIKLPKLFGLPVG